MGSTGTGKFGGYSGQAEEKDRCGEVKGPIRLEDVTTSEYFKTFGVLPPVGEDVFVMDRLVNKRVAVANVSNGLSIGYLPIKYNFMFEICMKNGYYYSGIISGNGLYPIPYLVVELHA